MSQHSTAYNKSLCFCTFIYHNYHQFTSTNNHPSTIF